MRKSVLIVLSFFFSVGCGRERCPQTKAGESKCVPASITQRLVKVVFHLQVLVVCCDSSLCLSPFLFYLASLLLLSLLSEAL